MSSLAEALKAAGFKSPRVEGEKEVEMMNSEIGNGKFYSHFNLDQLQECKSIKKFKFVAKGVLENNPHSIGKVIQIAHALFKGKEGDKKLFWILYSVRDNMSCLSTDKYKQLLDRAFRKSGANPTLSE
jgi:hypothetical protein